MTEKRCCETCWYRERGGRLLPCADGRDYHCGPGDGHSCWVSGVEAPAPECVEAAPIGASAKTVLDPASRWATLLAADPSLPVALDIIVRMGRGLDAIPADAAERITSLRDRIGELEGCEERADLLRERAEEAEEALERWRSTGRRLTRSAADATGATDTPNWPDNFDAYTLVDDALCSLRCERKDLREELKALGAEMSDMTREAKVTSDALDAVEINPNFPLGRRVEVLTKLHAEYQEANRKLVEQKSAAEREQLWCDHQMLGWDSEDGGLKPLCCAHLNEGRCFPCRKTEAECKRTAELGLLDGKCDYECARLTREERLSRQVDDLTVTAKYALWEAYLRRGCAFAEHRQACSPDAPGGDCDESCGICGGLKKFGMWEEEPRPGWDEQRSRVANLEAALEFYADESHHEETLIDADCGGMHSAVILDGGKRARTALGRDSTS